MTVDAIHEVTLRTRRPSYSVMQKCLEIQSEARGRGRVATFFGRTPLHPEARSWYRGALGEIQVAAMLSQLPRDWLVLHSVPVGSGLADIDHLLVGPSGVYSINTKNHFGKKIFVGGGSLLIDGYKTNYMRNSLHEAQRAGRLMSTATGDTIVVVPIIVVANAASIRVGRKAPLVTVLTPGGLTGWLQARVPIHTAREVAYYSLMADERSTWNIPRTALDDPMRHEQGFRMLQLQITAARRRSLWWTALAATAVTAAGVLAVLPVVPRMIAAFGG